MNNAFNILGAEPTDTAERLQELLDEKELLLDDISEVQAAYADLTNPKKRVKHEIEYLCEETFTNFNKLFLISRNKENLTIGIYASIVVRLGKWFESDHKEILERINNAREENGFTQIEDIGNVAQAVQSLKQDCIQTVNTYFDGIQKKSLVDIFNQVVKIKDYESFFIDELIAHYELIVNEVLHEKEQKFISAFGEIENICNQFNSDGLLSAGLDFKLTDLLIDFKSAITEWDTYAQPLQVNMQKRGGQHESSNKLVHNIRNKIVELCNKSQESLSKSLESFQSSNAENVKSRLKDSIDLTDSLISLINILNSVFIELELMSEQLKQDRDDLYDLRKKLGELYDGFSVGRRCEPIQPTYIDPPEVTISYEHDPDGRIIFNSDDYGGKFTNIIIGGLIVLSFILMIVSFSSEIILGGILMLVILVSTIVIAALKKEREIRPKFIRASVIIISIVFLITAICILMTL